MTLQGSPAGVRVPVIDGGRNFRDLGGYPTADGRRVRWGLVYRSGSLGRLTEKGRAQVRALGLVGQCDLRGTHERETEPADWHAGLPVAYWKRDYHTSFGDLREVMAGVAPEGAEAREAMLTGYRNIPYEQAPAYAELFRRLADGEVPLLFNCSAGKDRAGTAAALVLSALGVPREIVVEDHLLTNDLLDFRRAFIDDPRATMLAHLSPEVLDAVFLADADYIGTALDAIEQRSGSLEAYLDETLGIDAARLAQMSDRLLE